MLKYCLVFCLLTVSVFTHSTISPRTYNALNDLQEAVSTASTNDQYTEINENLLKLKQGLKGNSLGEALTLQIIAQLKDIQGLPDQAISALKIAYALKGLDDSTKGQIGTSLAYMYFSQGDFKNSITILKGYIAGQKKEVSPTVLAMLAMSYFSIDEFSQGLPFIERACETAKKANESWLVNAFAANYKLNNLQQAIYYTDLLIYNFPEKADYWNQKIGLHQSLEDYDKAALISSISYKQGHLTKLSQLFNLGVLMASSGAPYEVAVSLTEAIKDLKIVRTEKIDRLLMQAWVQAKEMGKGRAALYDLYNQYKKPKDGILLVNYLMDAELWQEAIKVSRSVTNNAKAKLTDKQFGSMLLMQGVSLYRAGNHQNAMIILGKALGLKDSASQAKSWMSYIKQMQG